MTDVLVAGAGPTGLTLACDLARRGVSVRIIDKSPGHFVGSRAKGLQERSMEVLDDLGVTEQIKAAGWNLPTRIYMGGKVVREIMTGSAAIILPQWSVEAALWDKLASWGVEVELGTEMLSFAQTSDEVVVTTQDSTIRAKYLVGCDGGGSTTRKALGIPFEGETATEQLLLLADAEVSGLSPDCTHMWIDPERGIFALTPFPTTKQWQVQLASVDAGSPAPAGFQRLCLAFTGRDDVALSNFTWMSSFRVNVRMVQQFRAGRVFLAGDAAHVHPPTGGLGMNTGIQDAYNLGWKLARALDGTASPSLLDTYQAERLPIAAWTLDTTSQALQRVEEVVRSGSDEIEAGVKDEHRQLGLGYPDSPLSKNLVSWDGPKAGDRAPWLSEVHGTGFTLLGFGAGTASALRSLPGVRTHLMPGESNTLVLVRPDGYIGMVAGVTDLKAVADYVSRP
jgi:2-polyprenyl-6-methoxyphenol hydroxylase-like FAD-dependent oxidoreductase